MVPHLGLAGFRHSSKKYFKDTVEINLTHVRLTHYSIEAIIKNRELLGDIFDN